ncbi:FAD-binding oxidoreductase [Microlunatus flavus]|uniref:Glycolate oxidase FAD binding subunit n=1 Tax=Microlunatus flavus TaxID=1036181 RepID=A0A1H9A8A5_9ACTN|nr:FAD-binding protein [Microlunatus flavus]SEP72889.1 glycolate oxidase FAD binding subunit [Microlunatus flavus]
MSELRQETASSPGRLERPSTTTEAAQLLSGTRGTLEFRGAGTKLDWAGRVADPDLVVDTRDLRGLLTHNPADMTASVRAGTPLTELQSHLRSSGQWLALDPPSAAEGATLGGLLASGDSGPSRFRYGGLRDLVIGVVLVLADGTTARSGGHVIKNVAGYDLAKLVYGSLGSLALVTEVVLRLHPLPAATTTVAADVDPAIASRVASAVMASVLEPAALELVPGPGTSRLLLRVDGSPGYVDAAAEASRQLLGGLGVVAERLDTDAADVAWQEQRRAVRGSDGDTVVRVSGLPTGLPGLASAVDATADALGLDAQVSSSVALGLHTVSFRGGAPQDHVEAVGALRAAATGQRASVLLQRRPAAVDALVDSLGPPPSSLELLRRVKEAFDPDGRCAPGRFRPWY